MRQAPRARRGYSLGWAYLLDVWAERRTRRRLTGAAIIGIAKVVNAIRGGDAAAIARSGGEILSNKAPHAEYARSGSAD
jgi:hypothetical protein